MTQEYTPVAWQDETTSQQGTLINAERLNQMQQAHHYADGWEEVDAIPTADPGVEYHKVVYCTADSTFYRWDGTAWTADIDDDTKRLLLEHEADHANPHQVTKAQVGLGNADNTSDQNKPVSTAQAAAIKLVQDYLDAHEANHSNPHAVTKAQVGLGNADNTADADKPISTATQTALDAKADKATTYTKTETDTLLGAKADKADTYDKTAVDGFLAGKVDKLISSPAGTYRSVTVNAQGQVTAGTNPTTLAGYGITDAYTKTEADTLLGAKANDNAVVHLAGAETIPGAKTFTANMVLSKGTPDFTFKEGVDIWNTTPASNRYITLSFLDKNGDSEGGLAFGHYTTGRKDEFLTLKGEDGTVHRFHLFADPDGKGYMTGPYRAYSAGNTDDVATIGTLDAYTPMVRTTGNQTMFGMKLLPEAVVGTKMINRVATTHALEVLNIANPSGGLTYLIHLIVSGRFDLELMRVAVAINSDASAVTSVTTTAQGIYALNNTRQIVAGARISNGKLKVSLRAKSGNTSISAMPMNCNVDGLTQTMDLSEYGSVTALSNMTGYVEEA